ncbi:MAG: hypothetical protein OEY78_04485 [Gammaproteobacteria bacterium]|nr:hypothetical protein [Gammaproteobacteria bacterium]
MLNFTGVTEAEKIEEAIHMLKLYAEEGTIEPFLSVLEALKDNSGDETLQSQLYDAFKKLGIYQGTILTYAPSIYHLISDNPFNE